MTDTPYDTEYVQTGIADSVALLTAHQTGQIEALLDQFYEEKRDPYAIVSGLVFLGGVLVSSLAAAVQQEPEELLAGLAAAANEYRPQGTIAYDPATGETTTIRLEGDDASE